ncbi:CocE/NonD family hydrolase [Halomicronema hongdechloris]|nr:CocE/NonD family hydrolase [Halomicronema hongdechloris]
MSLQTSDGCRLDADVYYPLAAGPFPVLLMRQPYGRAIASTVVYGHPSWYAGHGYIVVIQDVRGRGTSTGDFRLFAHEGRDGLETVEWAANLPQSNGRVGMYGFSYQGMTQLYAAAARPPALKALAPAMVGYDLYRDWAYENGALLLQVGLSWALQLAADTARLQGREADYQRLYAAAHDLPLTKARPACPQVLAELAPESFFHEWLAHRQRDDYWQALQPHLKDVDLPMLHVGGWFDPYLRGNLRLYREMVARSGHLQHLWIGPWGHIPWSRRVGALDLGPAAESPIDRLQLRWFDHWLKGEDSGLLQDSPVNLFEMGSNRWRGCQGWPLARERQYRWVSTGLASVRQDDGQLRWSKTGPAGPSHVPDHGEVPPLAEDILVHDPWRPVPSLGGHASVPAGPFDRAVIDCRSDVLTYTTEPLLEAMQLLGQGRLKVTCAADAPSFDLCAVVSQVYPDSRVMHLTQGYGRFETSQRQVRELPLHPVSVSIPAGHALRLSLSAACFPAYAVNPGTGTAPGQARPLEARVITVTVWGGEASALCLPIGGEA